MDGSSDGESEKSDSLQPHEEHRSCTKWGKHSTSFPEEASAEESYHSYEFELGSTRPLAGIGHRHLQVKELQECQRSADSDDDPLHQPTDGSMSFEVSPGYQNVDEAGYEEESPRVQQQAGRNGLEVVSRTGGGFDPNATTGSFKLDVPNIKGLKAMYPSAPFFAVMTPWRVVAKPFPAKGKAKYIGLYIACDAKSSNKEWSISTDCELRIYRPNGSFFSKTFKHVFVDKKREKGIDQFVTMNDLKQYLFRDKGLVEGVVNCQPPKNVEWDSRKITGYVGIINQGATCYMNSLLQALFATAEFRYTIYKIPTEFDVKIKSPAQGMQRIFYHMQFSPKAVESVKLTNSFNWTKDDAMIQQDIQEFLRMLLDRLGERMVGTRLEGTVDRLFGGLTINYSRCPKVNWKNERVEPFQDIGLNIKGKKTIIDSFQHYVKVEKCKGADKIQTEEFGPQEGVKGMIFKHFPPVLYLIMGRISFDMKQFKFLKINDKVIFPLKMNLDKFLDERVEEKADFVISSVLVHIGDANGGHYLVYVDPKCDGKWRKFDDDNVSLATKQDAVDGNYGGKGTRENPMKGMTNAYMLVYFQEYMMQKLTRDIPLSEIPEEIVAIFEGEKAEDEIIAREWSKRFQLMTVRCLIEAGLSSHQKPDLYDPKKPRALEFRVPKTELMNNFLKRLQSAFGYPPKALRIWPISQREGHLTMRVNYFSIEEQGTLTIAQAAERKATWDVYLDLARPSTDPHLEPHDPSNSCFCFFKYFDPTQAKLIYVGAKSIPHSYSTNQMKAIGAKMAHLPEDSYIDLYHEVNPDKVDLVNLWGFTRVFKIAEKVEDGEIFCFMLWQRGEFDYANPAEFLLDQSSQLVVTYVDNMARPKDRGVKIDTSIKFKYDQIRRFLGRHIGVSPTHLKLHKPNHVADKAGDVLNSSWEGDVQELFERFDNRKPKKFYYEIMPVPTDEVDTRERMTVSYIDNLYVETTDITVYPPKGSNVDALLEEVKKDFDVEMGLRGGSKRFRMLDIVNFKITRIFENKTPLSNLQANKRYRVEEVFAEELNLPATSCLMQVVHFNKSPASLHGHPFFIRIEDGESFSGFLDRLQDRNAITDVDFGLYKFALVKGNKAEYVTPKDYTKIKIKDFKNNLEMFFGMDHAKKFRQRKRPVGIVKGPEDVRMKIG